MLQGGDGRRPGGCGIRSPRTRKGRAHERHAEPRPPDAAPSPARRKGATEPTGRATFRQLLPFLFEHRPVLIWVAVLSRHRRAHEPRPAAARGPGHQHRRGGRAARLDRLGPRRARRRERRHLGLPALPAAAHRRGRGALESQAPHRKILRLPIAEFDTRRTGDLVSRVGSDTTMLRAVLTQGLVEAIGGTVTFVGALIAMLIIDPVLLGLTVLVIGRRSRRSRCSRGACARHRTSAGEGGRRRVGRRARSARCAPSAAGATDREIRDRRGRGRGRLDHGRAGREDLGAHRADRGIAMQVSFLVVLGVGGFRVASGAITVANLVAFILFLFMLIPPLGSAFGAITSVNLALGALGRIQEILDLPDETPRRRARVALIGRRRRGRAARRGDRVRRRALPPTWSPRGARDPRRRGLERTRPTAPPRGPTGHRPPPPGAARRLLPGAARAAHRAGRALGRRKVDDPRPHRALLRPGDRRGADGRTRRALARPLRAAGADRLRRAGRPGARRDARDNEASSARPTPPMPSASTCCAP